MRTVRFAHKNGSGATEIRVYARTAQEARRLARREIHRRGGLTKGASWYAIFGDWSKIEVL